MSDLSPAVLFLAVPGLCFLFAVAGSMHARWTRTVGKRTRPLMWTDEDDPK